LRALSSGFSALKADAPPEEEEEAGHQAGEDLGEVEGGLGQENAGGEAEEEAGGEAQVEGHLGFHGPMIAEGA
jgi:hypothetical protein